MRFVNIDHLLIHVDDGDYRGTDCDNAICQHRIKIMFVHYYINIKAYICLHILLFLMYTCSD